MRDYFCGWYLKCQSDKETIAVIPAFHGNSGKQTCSVQIITDDGAWNTIYPIERFHKEKRGFRVTVGDCVFCTDGMTLDISTPELTVKGEVRFGKWTPIKYDVMGPFRFVPFMECRHSVLSMRHTVNGEITVNGKTYTFVDANGYIEGDRGYSFPKEYAWTHCFFDGGSIMLSVADIPIGPVSFTGMIGIIHYMGKEYRLATYLNAKAEKIRNGELVIRQGNMKLTAKLIEKRAHPLNAPISGAMTRTIRESAACKASYKFEKSGEELFSFTTDHASFEYEYKD